MPDQQDFVHVLRFAEMIQQNGNGVVSHVAKDDNSEAVLGVVCVQEMELTGVVTSKHRFKTVHGDGVVLADITTTALLLWDGRHRRVSVRCRGNTDRRGRRRTISFGGKGIKN